MKVRFIKKYSLQITAKALPHKNTVMLQFIIKISGWMVGVIMVDFTQYEKQIIKIFKQELTNQGKLSSDLTEDNNPNSTIKSAKIFRIFGPNPSRLAFADFMQLCHLLNLTPSNILDTITNNNNNNVASVDDTRIIKQLETLINIITTTQQQASSKEHDKDDMRLLSKTQAQKILGISATNFYTNFKPYIPSYKIGGKHYYKMKDINQFIEQNKQQRNT